MNGRRPVPLAEPVTERAQHSLLRAAASPVCLCSFGQQLAFYSEEMHSLIEIH